MLHLQFGDFYFIFFSFVAVATLQLLRAHGSARVQANALPNPQGLVVALRPYAAQGANSSYLGCMKSGPVITDFKSPWYEPLAWKFGGTAGADGGMLRNYPLHATANGYALSRSVALHLAVNADLLAVRLAFARSLAAARLCAACALRGCPAGWARTICALRRSHWGGARVQAYSNEDVMVGAWLLGLDVQHVYEGAFCCTDAANCGRASHRASMLLRQQRGVLASGPPMGGGGDEEAGGLRGRALAQMPEASAAGGKVCALYSGGCNGVCGLQPNAAWEPFRKCVTIV